MPSDTAEAMCLQHEIEVGEPVKGCSKCGSDPHRHNGERSDVRLEARRRMGGRR